MFKKLKNKFVNWLLNDYLDDYLDELLTQYTNEVIKSNEFVKYINNIIRKYTETEEFVSCVRDIVNNMNRTTTKNKKKK